MTVISCGRIFKTLDVKFAADLVGDENSGIKGQFETNVHRTIGEINEDVDKITKILAPEAAA